MGIESELAKLRAGLCQAVATFTPAATAHAAADVVGGAQQFTFSPQPSPGGLFRITDCELEIDGATAEASAYRVYLYNATPPSALADDAAWDLVAGDRASFLGYVDLGTAVDLGSTQWVETHGINKPIKLPASGVVFGYLICVAGLTPQAVAHTVKLYGVPG